MTGRKNVVLISFDDAVSYWHYRDMFGVRLQTPALDRICSQSTAFLSAYCQSPLCGPSRASFMSAKTPPETGVLDNTKNVFTKVPPEQMWPFRLKQAGYFCSSGGKVHHGYKPLPPKVHQTLYSDERKAFRIDIKLRPEFAQARLGGRGGGIATTDAKDDGHYHDAQSAASFIRFIENYDGDAPFYREVGFFSPHLPNITPLRFKTMYPAKTINYPPDWADGFERSGYSDTKVGRNFRTGQQDFWQKSIRNYLSALSHGDHHLGRVWDALKTSRFADNTVVVILSDHGHHLGEDSRFRKSTLWEQSALVPLIIHDPDDGNARVVTDPVALLDVGPTVLDYTGLPPLERCSGRSLKAIVQGAAADPERAVPTFNPHGASVRKGKYRFIRYKDGSTELYDLSTDWWQQRRLGPKHEDYRRMRRAHRDCCRAYGQAYPRDGAEAAHG